MSIPNVNLSHVTIQDGVRVEGVKAKGREAMANQVNEFIRSGSVIARNENQTHFQIDLPKGARGNIRGPQTTSRVEIQGPQGERHVRIAYQEGGAVLAQVSLPVNTMISDDRLLFLFEKSASHQRGVLLGTSEDIVRSEAQRKQKKQAKKG